jgi:enoyl-[acyl-carrier-protein] reductase (NADH)
MTVSDRFRLDGQVAVVTGAGTGIGRGIAVGLAQAGADVVVAGRRLDPLGDTARRVEAEGRSSLVVATDVTSPGDLERLGAAAADTFGSVSIWVQPVRRRLERRRGAELHLGVEGRGGGGRGDGGRIMHH